MTSELLPPFRALVGRLDGLRLEDLYAGLFEAYYHQATATQTWDLEQIVPVVRRQGGAALDIGCGRGRVTLALSDEGCTVTAVDRSPAGLTYLADRCATDARRGRLIRIVHGDFLDRDTDVGHGYAAAVLGDLSLNLFWRPEAVIDLFARVREVLTANGVFCLSVLTEETLPRFQMLNGVVASPFRDDTGRERLLLACLHFDPAGPFFRRTLFLQDDATPTGDFVGHVTASKERLWTRSSLAPHVHTAGFRIETAAPVVIATDQRGTARAEVLILSPSR